MKKDTYYVYKNTAGNFVKVIYRVGSLFTQILDGKKDNYHSVSFSETQRIIKNLGLILTDKKFVSYGIGWDVA